MSCSGRTSVDPCRSSTIRRAACTTGTGLPPNRAPPELLDADSAFDLDPGWLSADPFYLDSLENDPLALVEADGASLGRELDKA